MDGIDIEEHRYSVYALALTEIKSQKSNSAETFDSSNLPPFRAKAQNKYLEEQISWQYRG